MAQKAYNYIDKDMSLFSLILDADQLHITMHF